MSHATGFRRAGCGEWDEIVVEEYAANRREPVVSYRIDRNAGAKWER